MMPILLGIAAGAVLILAALIVFTRRQPADEPGSLKIHKGVTINGIQIGGMTESEAISAVSGAIGNDLQTRDMILAFPNRKHSLSPADTGVHWNIESAVEQAMSADANTALSMELSVDSDYIYTRLNTILDALGGAYIPSGYTHEDQLLTLNTGKSGIQLDVEELYRSILDAYRSGSFYVQVAEFGPVIEPEALDIDTIHQEIYVAPTEPQLNRESMTVTPGAAGYGFDLEAARELLSNAAHGDVLQIPCTQLLPSIADEDVWFQDVLGKCKTPHNDNENRNENLRLACSKLNGLILQPEETVSYNELLGPRTAEKGYKPAPAYSGTELVDEIGGGICQVSSTFYLSSLLAELKIVSRTNHGFPVDYIPIGLDATVNWGTTDLKIRNNRDYPIKIQAEVTDEYVSVQILGIETRDYYVKINHVVEGPRYASAYLCHYDPATDKEIFRTLDHASLYLDVVWQWPDYADNERIVTYR